MSKKILYNFWGYLSNRYGISAPDGNASYSPWIINSFLDNGYEVFAGPIDRDKSIINQYGLEKSFSNFMTSDRIKAYSSLKFVDLNHLPDVDILLLEWRFETIYNTLNKNDPKFCPDLEIQKALLDHYYGRAKVVVLDLDIHFTEEEVKKYPNIKVIRQEDISLGVPIEVLTPSLSEDVNKIFSYVGNEYKKMIDISRKISPVSEKYKGLVHFYGNWTREDKKPFRDCYPYLVYHDRIGIGEFREAMSDSLFVPLMATEAYRKRGFMTFRLAEALMFGSIPLGFSDFKNIEKFLPKELIINMDDFVNSMNSTIDYFLNLSFKEREKIRDKAASKVAKEFSIKRLFKEITT